MPDALEFSGYGGEVISRSLDFIELDLPATAFDKSVDFSGSCVNSLSFNVGTAASTITVWPGDLYSSIDTDECNVTIRVTTTSFGEVDPALHPSSTFTLIRERETTFYSVP
ncbi:MAG: hypothetical protein R3B70_18530 [Polyangiaceae bacterium]